MSKIRHVLGISGGKDSAALAIYMKNNYPHLDLEYYTCDTGKELDETYLLIDRLENFLGKEIKKLRAVERSHEDPFDHFLARKGGYLPSSAIRWCTRTLKLEPFERFVGNDLVVSYVGIRGDENREGYVSTKPNIQSIFPFRRNIWSEDVISKILSNHNIEHLLDLSSSTPLERITARFLELLGKPITFEYNRDKKLNDLLNINTKDFNRLVFAWLQSSNYPLGAETDFPLVENETNFKLEDIYDLLKESGVGIPAYYKKLPFEVDGFTGDYSRSRSGCYFCFYQQRIEWVWLYEQHPDLYSKAMEYEKEGYTWGQNESLTELIRPERIKQIKLDFLSKENSMKINKKSSSPYLIDRIEEEEEEEEVGCAACFL